MPQVDLQELGRTGLPHYNGRIVDETLPELSGSRWPRVARQMMNDPVVSAVLFSIEMLARQTTWDVKASSEAREDEKAADFFRGALFEDMSQTWADTLSEILTFLPWGWSYPEIVYKRRRGEANDPGRRSRFTDGRVGWRKWASRSQESLDRWEFDEEGGVRAMVQAPAPDFLERTIPIEKALLFRTTAHKGNPQPPGILRRTYRPWYFKTHIENVEGVGIERDMAGLPLIYAPVDWFSSTATPEQKAALAMCQKIATSIKRDEQEGIVFPVVYDDNNNQILKIELLTSGGKRQFDTDKVIQRYDQRILMTVMADFLMLGHQKVGSFALSNDKTELFSVALGAWLDSVCDVVNRHAIPRLARLNGMRRKKLPQLIHGDVEKVDLEALGEYIAKLSGAQIGFSPEEQMWLKQQIKGMPVVEQEVDESKDQSPPDKDADEETEVDVDEEGDE